MDAQKDIRDLLRAILEGQGRDRAVLHEQRTTINEAVRAVREDVLPTRNRDQAHSESVLVQNAELKERMSEIIDENSRLRNENGKLKDVLAKDAIRGHDQHASASRNRAPPRRESVKAGSLAAYYYDSDYDISSTSSDYEPNIVVDTRKKRRLDLTYDGAPEERSLPPQTRLPKRMESSQLRQKADEDPVELVEVIDELHFWNATEETRHPYAELSENVQSALQPYLEFYTTTRRHLDAFSRDARDETKCTLVRVRCEHKPRLKGMRTCELCVQRSLPCFLVEEGYPPTVVPLPVGMRMGKGEEDPSYWIPGYKTPDARENL